MDATTITFTNPELSHRAQQKARQLGLSLAEYVSRLVAQDTQLKRKPLTIFPVESGWGPVPAAVNARWDREIAQAEQEYTQGKRKGHGTVEGLMQDLAT